MPTEFSYNERYGIRTGKHWMAPAIFLAIVGLGWSIWAGLHFANPPIRFSLISYSITSDREISLRYSVQRQNKNAAVICTLIARDFNKEIVGQIDELIEPGLASLERTTTVKSRGPAVNANVIACRLK